MRIMIGVNQSLLRVRHAFYFYAISWRQFEGVIDQRLAMAI